MSGKTNVVRAGSHALHGAAGAVAGVHAHIQARFLKYPLATGSKKKSRSGPSKRRSSWNFWRCSACAAPKLLAKAKAAVACKKRRFAWGGDLVAKWSKKIRCGAVSAQRLQLRRRSEQKQCLLFVCSFCMVLGCHRAPTGTLAGFMPCLRVCTKVTAQRKRCAELLRRTNMGVAMKKKKSVCRF